MGFNSIQPQPTGSLPRLRDPAQANPSVFLAEDLELSPGLTVAGPHPPLQRRLMLRPEGNAEIRWISA